MMIAQGELRFSEQVGRIHWHFQLSQDVEDEHGRLLMPRSSLKFLDTCASIEVLF